MDVVVVVVVVDNQTVLTQGYMDHFSKFLADHEFSAGCRLFIVFSSDLLFASVAMTRYGRPM